MLALSAGGGGAGVVATGKPDKCRQAALDFIRPYVERGDSLESLQKSCMSRGGPSGESCQIGGYFDTGQTRRAGIRGCIADIKSLKPGEVGVKAGRRFAILKLKDLYNEIASGWEKRREGVLRLYDF